MNALTYINKHIEQATTVINTNGALLKPELSRQLLDAGLSLISLSIDGNNGREYEQIRSGLKWDDLCDNIRALRQMIDDGGYKTQVHIRGLHMKDFKINEAAYYNRWNGLANKVIVRNDHDPFRMEREKMSHRLRPCHRLFSQMIFMVDGGVSMCAYDWDGVMQYGCFPEKDIQALWRTPGLRFKRLLHLLGLKKLIPFCRRCTYRAY